MSGQARWAVGPGGSWVDLQDLQETGHPRMEGDSINTCGYKAMSLDHACRCCGLGIQKGWGLADVCVMILGTSARQIGRWEGWR